MYIDLIYVYLVVELNFFVIVGMVILMMVILSVLRKSVFVSVVMISVVFNLVCDFFGVGFEVVIGGILVLEESLFILFFDVDDDCVNWFLFLLIWMVFVGFVLLFGVVCFFGLLVMLVMMLLGSLDVML